MARPKKSLAKWIGEAVADNDKEHTITQLSLVHMKGNVPLEIHKVTKFGNEFNQQKVADLFEDKAAVHSQELIGPQTFNVWAFYKQEKPEAFFIFLQHPSSDAERDGNGYLSTEAPTEQGMRQQEMRWREMDRGLVYRQQQALNSYSLQVIEQQARELANLRASQFDNAQMVLNMMATMHDNTHKLRIEEIQAQKSAQMQTTLVKMLPAGLNTLFGREIVPQSLEDTSIVDGIIDGLMKSSSDPADLMTKAVQMMGMLGIPEAMMGILGSRIKRGVEERMKEAAELAQAKNVGLAKVSPQEAEDDVTGGTVVPIKKKMGGGDE